MINDIHRAVNLVHVHVYMYMYVSLTYTMYIMIVCIAALGKVLKKPFTLKQSSEANTTRVATVAHINLVNTTAPQAVITIHIRTLYIWILSNAPILLCNRY